MTRSMTAFARAQAGNMAWEIRTVNQRYLDPVFKLPDNLRVLEPDLRNILKDKVARGKVDCLFRYEMMSTEVAEAVINEEQLRHISRLVDHVASVSKNVAPISPLEILRWPGVLADDSTEFEELQTRIRDLFHEALESLVAMREREGAELQRLLLDRLDHLASIVNQVRREAPAIMEKLSVRMRDKIAELNVEPDTSRLEQELVYIAQKSDVYEELDRLDTHIEEVRSTLGTGGTIGRRLDFLMQELNREANTLSAKSSAAEMSIQAVELKVVIEQMREQIQNIE